MKIDRKKLANKCGYDQTECLLLAKRLASLPDDEFLKELQKIKVWNYGKCELGLWADVLDRLDAILEDATTKVGLWTLKVDSIGDENYVQNIVTVLEFTSHLIEHSIYRCLYGSWSHIVSLFSTSNMDILLAVLGLTYNFSKRSNYFARLDESNRTEIYQRLSAIARSWGGGEKGYDLPSCCLKDHMPPDTGFLNFLCGPDADSPNPENEVIHEDLRNSSKSPSEIMEELLKKYRVSLPSQKTLFAELRLEVYISDPEKRMKCIKARLQAISTICYAFAYDNAIIYPGLLEELVDVVQLPDGEVMSIKACALRTMTAIFNIQRANLNVDNILESPEMVNFHRSLPTRIQKWIRGLVEGTCDASGGSVNQQYTIALLSFLYHLATFEQSYAVAGASNRTLSSSGIIDSMIDLIAWHVPRNDYLSYVTRAVRVTDQIISGISSTSPVRQLLVTRLIERLDYETDLVISPPPELAASGSGSSEILPPLGILNTQRSGLMKSILNLLKRISSEQNWSGVITAVMISGQLPSVLLKIYTNKAFLVAPHLVLFAVEIITTFIYAFPSNISDLQEKGVTTDVLNALSSRPLPAFREFLIQLPLILRSLTLNAAGKDAVLKSGILERYVETLVSREYLGVMRSRRTRDPPTYSQGNLNGLSSSPNLLSGALAIQMAQNFQELIRSHQEFRFVVFDAILRGFEKIREAGEEPAKLIPTSTETSGSGGDGSRVYMTTGASVTGRHRRRRHRRSGSGDSDDQVESMDIDLEVMHVGDDSGANDVEMEGEEEDIANVLGQTGHISLSSLEDPDAEDAAEEMLSGSDGNASDVDHHHHQAEQQTPAVPASSSTNLPSTSGPLPQPDPASSSSSADPSTDNQGCILDYILNLCKFMERLHGLGADWDAMNRNSREESHRLYSQDGVAILFDVLTMPGLPYEFPSSYSCAVFAQSIMVLLNQMQPIDIFSALFNKLQKAIGQATSALEELKKSLPDGVIVRDYFSSRLLSTDHPNSSEMNFLHSLSTITSILCVVVSLNIHMKPSARGPFIDVWSKKEYMRDLGHLYQEVIWEAAVILSMIREGTHQGGGGQAETGERGGIESAAISPVDETGDPSSLGGEMRGVFPRCVEGLSLFKILTPSLSTNGSVTNAHRVLCVAACFTNSVTELCSSLTNLCTSVILSERNASSSSSTAAASTTSSRRPNPPAIFSIIDSRRLDSPQADPTASTTTTTTIQRSNTRMATIARMALFIAETFVWRPPLPLLSSSTDPSQVQIIPRLQNALQYSAFHLTHAFFDQHSGTRALNTVILGAFALIGGMQYVFEEFSECLVLAKGTNVYDEETFSRVLEGMLVDIDRLTDLTTFNIDSSGSRCPFDLPKYSKYLFTLLLKPLCLICDGNIMKKLTVRSVESLLNIFKNYVPFIYSFDAAEADVTSDPIAEMGFSQADFESYIDSDSTRALLEGIRAVRPCKNLVSIISESEALKNVSYLKQHLFEACFSIAKQFNSDETVQMVAEVIVSTNVESSNIEQLVGIVSRELMALTSQTPSMESSKDVEVALHLLAYYFSRSRFACVRTFSRDGVPDLLYKLLISVNSEASDRYSPRLYALSALLIDQYERALTALRLRKRVVDLYAGQHSWAWFDESANLWHEHNVAEIQSADKAFHEGVFRGTIHSIRPKNVEFVPMVQVGDNNISRPILLFPKLPTSLEQPPVSSNCPELTKYEESILHEDDLGEMRGQELYQLSLSQRKALCSALVSSFEKGKLDVSCCDNFLRLLLRFAATSFDDAETLVKSNALKTLFDFSPPDNLKTHYRSLLGHLLRHLFYNRKALKAKMSEVVGQIFQGSSSLMQWCRKDLFFSLAAVAPLMARDEELALEVFKEHTKLTIPEEDLKEGSLPRSYLLEINPKVDDPPEVLERLNERQKAIISFLADRITTGSTTEECQGTTSKPSEKVLFEKELCLSYLMDLATSSRSVAEGLCKIKSFITHLFTEGLRSANSSSTINLLVTIIFSASSASQVALITDFKSTLRSICNSSSYSLATDTEESVCNNQHIIGLMQFLKATLNLPHPVQITVVRHFFKRHVVGELARLLAVVNCKVSNGTEALNAIMKVLEIFTQIESQILQRRAALGTATTTTTETQVSVVSTVADAMMHTAAETAQPLASALVPSIVETVDSVHPAPTTTSSSQRQPSTTTHHHITEEGDTWAEAEDASEIGDTTVEDSTAILVLDEGGVQNLGGSSGRSEGNHDGDNTDGDDEDVDNYHDVGDVVDDEELTSEDSQSQGSADEDEEEESNQDEDEDGDHDEEAFSDENDDDDDFHDDLGTSVVTDGDDPPDVNLLNNLMTQVFDVANSDGGTTHIPNRQNDHRFVLQFTTLGGRDEILPGERLIDFVTEGSSRYGFMSRGNSFFVGEANSASGGDVARSIQNIYRNSNLALPSRTPLIFLPPGSGTNLRSVTGGVSDTSNTTGNINSRQPRHNVASASRRDTSGAGSSTYLTVVPNSSRATLARLGALVNTPILVRTSFAPTGQTPGYLSLGQPNIMHVPPFSSLSSETPRPNRRRQNAQGGSSSSTASRRRSSLPEMNDSDGDNQAFAMLMDLEDISVHAINEASRNALNGLTGAAVGTLLPLNTFFSIISAYRHFLASAEILYGQEIMDMLLLARHEVGVFAVEARQNIFSFKLQQYQQQQKEDAASAEAQQPQAATAEQQQQQVGLSGQSLLDPAAHHTTYGLACPVVRLVDIGPQLTGNADRLILSSSDVDEGIGETAMTSPEETATAAAAETAPATAEETAPSMTTTEETAVSAAGEVATAMTVAEEAAMTAADEAATTSEQQEAPVPGPSTSTGEHSATTTSTAEPARIPVTDDEILTSMIASGVDPSFLDALPAELRRELMEDHQRSLRVHSSMMGNVPADVDQTVLASLPPELQEEVLGAYRDTAAAVNASNATTSAITTADVFNSMPAHLRREVLADMEDSQLAALTPELQAEARQIREQEAERHAHLTPNPPHHHHHHHAGRQGGQNQVRSFGSLMFPAFFDPSGGPTHPADFFIRSGRGIRGISRSTGITPASITLLINSIPIGKSKALLDHEGLSCLIGMVIACSGSPDIRRSTYVIVKRVIENICSHAPTRCWLIATILNVVKGLSDSFTSSRKYSTSSSTSIFGCGFERPAGGFVQNILIDRSTGSVGIHPQASQNVCFSLLDVLYDIVALNLAQFVPSANETPQASGCEMKTDFWEIVAQMTTPTTADVVPSSSSRKSVSPARIRSSGKHHLSSSRAPSDSSFSEEQQLCTALNPFDCYVHIVGFLRHPVVRSRSVLQERVISLLVRILDEYHKTRTQQNAGAAAVTVGDADQDSVRVIIPLVGSIIEDLCDLVISTNSSDQTRTLVTWLIVLMTQVEESTKKPFFDLLAAGANSLAKTIENQLADVIDEVNRLSPNSKRRLHDADSTTHLQHSDSMTRLTPSYATVTAGPSTSRASLNPPTSTPGPASSTRDLELSTLFSMPKEQSRLCRILKLMLYLSSCPEVSLQSLKDLSTLWKRLSDVLDSLQGTSENTIWMFQPLVECMCLAHANHTQTAVWNNGRVVSSGQLIRRGSTTPWTGTSLPGSINSPLAVNQNIIIFNGFPEAAAEEERRPSAASPGEGSASPPVDTLRALSPDPTAPQGEKPVDTIAWFAEKHRVSLNQILRKHNTNLSESALSVFLSYPKCLDFDVKRKFLHSRFDSLRLRSTHLRQDEEHISISRSRIFEDSFARLHSKTAQDWKKRFVIQFRNEEGQDAGGLSREWYLLMSREIFNPMYGLFCVSPSDRVTYTINPASSVNSNHLTYFEFVGRFIAKAIYDNKHLECYFTRSFYKHILGKQVRFQDLESEDYDFYKGLDFLLNHRIAELNYEVTFCTEKNEYGRSETVDLIENGRNIVVTDENKKEYVRLLCHQKMTESIRQQLDAFLKGFYSIIPKGWINIFNEQELELLICGLPKIDLEDLRNHTSYNKYQFSEPQIQWFWKALESFEEEDRARFIQFVTGTSRVPLGGFQNLEGMHGPTHFTISRASVSSTSHLPSAHTCFNTLELPAYTSYEQLRDRLLTAIRECSEGYGMA